jgi:RimJ/RimL family protein N-acetyltransferase
MVANGAPARVLAKLGMRYEGLLRESRQRGDCFFDMKLFAILSTDLP